jgi:hypothetical protein
MSRSVATVLLLLVVAPLQAGDEPEALLPATTQIYVRWDGVQAHRAAYARTGLGKMLQGDTGAFLAGNFGRVQTSLSGLLTGQSLLTGTPPAQLEKLLKDVADSGQLLELLGKHGLVLGLELRSAKSQELGLTLIVPDAGSRPGPLFGVLRLATTLFGADVKTKTIDGRRVQSISVDPLHVAWWAEGNHALITIGTDSPEAAVRRVVDRNQRRLPENSLFRKARDFKEFETSLRGFVDIPGLLVVARTLGKDVQQLVAELGFDGVRSVILQSGFDSARMRTVIEMDMPGPRKGLLRLAPGRPFTLADVPPLPIDVTSWSMSSFDLGAAYDTAVPALEQLLRIIAPDQAKEVAPSFKALNEALGIDLRKDLLGALGDRFATYSSPAEGPLTLGQTFLFRVNDEKKLRESLETAIKGSGKSLGVDINIRKKKYHGIELHEIHVDVPGFVLLPTYAIDNGWLILSSFPQAVQGYTLRLNGELPTWKPDDQTAATLARLPRRFTSVAVSDPRPALRALLSFAPPVTRGLQQVLQQSGLKEFPIDVGSLPNAHEATRHLFPNVSVTTDDGQVARIDSRSSLPLPLAVGGVDSYSLVALAVFAFNFL